ncbi:hypothetical protein PI95_011825 [Hassallia byssoidea VB512170]|uniref:SPOR domain-containing protein n=1 Tax=Hassallia byssoidea VB512170 TaxID=1304833 RepID=A0A846H818_9CYAN|nr:hypothetical protein [Hassalia byssoidea]NEU73233.1 hypothetical protein [Hassalia byssoidea VB512170]
MSQEMRLLGTQSSKTPGLKPQLASALSCLEVQLDQELARYRRTRTGYNTPNQSRVSSNAPQLQQTAIAALDQVLAAGIALKKPVPTPTLVQDATVLQPNTPSASVEVETPQSMPAATTVNTEIQNPPKVEVIDKTDTPNKENGSIVPAVVKSDKTENTPSEVPPKQPDDYLESSEALLRSLTEEQPQKRKPSNSDNLLSPLGIGSMLLLLVASLTLGYVLFNPKSLSVFGFGGKSQPNSPPTASTTNVKNTEVAKPQTPTTPIPKYPNLATDEFPEVNDPNDVVGLKPKPKPTPTAIPKPVAAQIPANLPVAPIQQAQPLPGQMPTPKATTSPKPELPLTEVKPSADGFYHIITENQGASAFASARVVVPDAYLSPDGKFIYLGALKTKEQVKQQMQLLQSKGIKARVEQP